MNDLLGVYTYLRSFVDLEMSDLTPLFGKYERVSYKTKDVIFAEGEHFTKITFLLSGLVKKYYVNQDGREFIKEFTWAGQATTPYLSVLTKSPTTYTLEALEPTEILAIDYSVIEKLSEENIKWLKVCKALADYHFINRELREMELLRLSATERYATFQQRFPHLRDRIKKQDLASYLGITPVSLSRLEGQF